MATELRPTDAAIETPELDPAAGASLSIVQRGRNVLRMLQHAARAAHLQSQVIELEDALQRACAGQPQALQLWLDRFQLPSSDAAHEQPAQAMLPPAEAFIGEQGWSIYLEQARQRLNEHRLANGYASPWELPALRQPSEDSQYVAVADASHRNQPFAEDGPGPSLLDDTLDEPKPDSLDDEGSSVELPLTSIPLLGLGCLPESSAEPRRSISSSSPRGKRLFGSYGLSIAGHAIALIVLGSITLKAPAEGDSLGSQVLNAAQSRSETELSNELEMMEPVAIQVSEPVVEPTAVNAVSSELSQLSRSIAPTSIEVGGSTSVPSTIVSAMADAPRNSGSRSSGGGVPSMNGNFFGVGTGGNYFCYVVDSSGSMRGGAWESAKAELMRSIKSLKPTQRFYIVFFADDFVALPQPGSDQPAPTGLYATASNIEHARRWIGSVELQRGGPPNEALAWAIEREPDAIYLLTDGVTKVDVCGFLRKNNRIEDIVSGVQVRVPIHAIAYFSLDGQQLMRQLAKENQGQFIYVPKLKK